MLLYDDHTLIAVYDHCSRVLDEIDEVELDEVDDEHLDNHIVQFDDEAHILVIGLSNDIIDEHL